MKLLIKKTFAQPGRAFHAGKSYEVPDDEAARMIELGLAEAEVQRSATDDEQRTTDKE